MCLSGRPSFAFAELAQPLSKARRSLQPHAGGLDYGRGWTGRVLPVLFAVMVGDNLRQDLDKASMTGLHWRVWTLSALGIFLDGFDFFIMGLALPLIQADFGITDPWLAGLIVSAALLGAIVGAGVLGPLTDRIGRKTVYVIDLALFVVFAALSASAWSVTSLIIFRFCLGIGIGADYPIAATYVAEIVPSRIRGRLLVGAFAFQALGMLFGSLVAIAALEILPQPDAWRIMLLVGVAPAVVIAFLRMFVPESPRWLIAHGKDSEAANAIALFINRTVDPAEVKALTFEDQKPRRGTLNLLAPRYIRRTALVCVPWFLMDIATYGIGLFTPTILAVVAFGGAQPGNHFLASVINSVEGAAFLDIFLVVGFVLAILLIDRVGRIPLQLAGFAAMSVGLLVLAFAAATPETNPDGSTNILRLMQIFGGFITFNVCMNMGPNSTTYTLPAEVFPTELRATAHGFASASGKVGAAVATFFFPIFRNDLGINMTILVVAGACALAFLITYACRVEPKGRSLEAFA